MRYTIQLMDGEPMIVSFSRKNNNDVNEYWIKKFEYVVENTRQILLKLKSFIKMEYLPVFQHIVDEKSDKEYNKNNVTLSKCLRF